MRVFSSVHNIRFKKVTNLVAVLCHMAFTIILSEVTRYDIFFHPAMWHIKPNDYIDKSR